MAWYELPLVPWLIFYWLHPMRYFQGVTDQRREIKVVKLSESQIIRWSYRRQHLKSATDTCIHDFAELK